MRTLSARIVLGFAVLIVAFGVITGTLVWNAYNVENEVHLVSGGYLRVALDLKELVLREDNLSKYLNVGITEETKQTALKSHLNRYVKERHEALAEARSHLDSVSDLSELDRSKFGDFAVGLEHLDASTRSSAPVYDALVKRGPIGATINDDPDIGKLRDAETAFADATNELSRAVRTRVLRTSEQLEENEHTLRQRALYMGALAVLLALLVAVWAVVNLRPLTRLRATARQVAAGDYQIQITERGPAEVADLAREFNSMGRAIQERERELVRSERLAAVGKMAAMITHEVRNPLSSIGLNTELLEDELAPDATEARALCRAITREVDRLTAITEEYLAFARLPKPKVAAESIQALVQALATFVREDLAARKIELIVEPPQGAADPIALVDAAQLRQCLVNLVRNAADAVVSRGGGHIWLRTRHDAAAGRVSIEVADDGTGIAPELLPRLFDSFFSTKDGGNGLGLALTQQIVRDHGGELAVTSELGHGTTFTVTVPAGGPPTERDAASSAG